MGAWGGMRSAPLWGNHLNYMLWVVGRRSYAPPAWYPSRAAIASVPKFGLHAILTSFGVLKTRTVVQQPGKTAGKLNATNTTLRNAYKN